MKLLRKPYLHIFLFGVVLLVIPQETHAAWLDWETMNQWFQNVAYSLVVAGLGPMLWFSASLLDFAINNFVIGFGNTFANTGIGVAVDNTWIIIRDFVNLFFIFGFVYIGFKMILDASNSNTRRWLVNIILAALLVNFSLFIVKFAIDISNQLAAQIAVNGLSSTGGNTGKDGLFQVDLTAEFMARMGLASLLNVQNLEGAGWGYVFGSAALFLTASFVFAAGGILLIIRFAMLCLFIVMSPVMFMSWVLPPVKDTMQRFWSELFGRAAFAPIYLLFIYFSLQLISGLQVSVDGNGSSLANPNWRGAFENVSRSGESGVTNLGTLPFFVLICIFLTLSLTMASKLGMDFGDKAVSLGKSFERKVRGAVGGATLGMTARIGRNTGGALADKFVNSETGKRWAANSFAGKQVFKAAGKAADATWDVRNVGGVGKAMGIGESSKGGFVTRQKATVKKETEFLDSLAIDDKDGAAKAARTAALGSEEYKPHKEAQEAAKKEVDEQKKKVDEQKKKIDSVKDPYRNEIRNLNTQLAAETDPNKREQIIKRIAENDAAMQAAAKAEEEAQQAVTKQLAEDLAKAEAAHKEAEDGAKKFVDGKAMRARYKHELDYLERREKETKNEFLGKSKIRGGGLAGGIAGGAVAGTLAAGGAGVLVGGAIKGELYKDKNVVEELRNKYGEDGSKKEKSAKEQKALKEQAAALKEAAGKDEKKEGEEK